MIYLDIPQNIADKEFLKRYIKDIIFKILKMHLNKNYLQIEEYLKTNYKCSLLEVFKAIKENIILSEVKNKVILLVEDNSKLNGYRLKDIINLIDNGNLSIKGSKLITDSFNYLKKNLYYIYFYYLATGKVI